MYMSKVEKATIERCVTEAAKESFHPFEVNNGGDTNEPATTIEQVLNEVDATGMAHVHFKGPGNKIAWAFFIIGNGEYCLSDYTCTPGFENAMERATAD